MRQNEIGPSLPYTARYSLGWRLFAVFVTVLLIWLLGFLRLPDGRLAILGSWEASGWLRKATILFMFAMVPGVPLVTFSERIDFQTSLIKRRTWYGKWIEYPYEDIVKLEVFEHELTRLRFRDDRVLRIWGKLIDPRVVESIVKAQARHRFETIDGR